MSLQLFGSMFKILSLYIVAISLQPTFSDSPCRIVVSTSGCGPENLCSIHSEDIFVLHHVALD